MRSCMSLLLGLFCFSLFGQVERDTTYITEDNYILYSGENPTLELDEIQILPKLKFENYEAKKYYYWFRRRVLKAYPFAEIASEKLNSVNDSLALITSKRKRKKYVRQRQKYLEKEFAPQLKKLTTTEGRVLIKLMYRQTGMTTFEVVKDYRSGWRAFWYNTTASVFKLSLKEEYHPDSNLEDYMIEDILQRADVRELIDLMPPKIDIEFYQIPVPDSFAFKEPQSK